MIGTITASIGTGGGPARGTILQSIPSKSALGRHVVAAPATRGPRAETCGFRARSGPARWGDGGVLPRSLFSTSASDIPDTAVVLVEFGRVLREEGDEEIAGELIEIVDQCRQPGGVDGL